MPEENDQEIDKAAGPWKYVGWGVLLWLMVSAVILLSGGNSKFIYIDF